MNLYLSHMTALWFWRTVYPANRVPSGALLSCEIQDPCSTADDTWSKIPAWADRTFSTLIEGCVESLVDDRLKRWSSREKTSHLWSSQVPPGSFYEAGDGVYMSSPEFLFLQLAPQCSLRELVFLGCELCGTFAFDPFSERGFRKRTVPLTTKARLEGYLEGAGGTRGVAKARRAMQFVIEGAASPMEVMVALLMCLPLRLGGYGLVVPYVNFEIPLPANLQARLGKPYVVADFCWKDFYLVLEYQGEHDHTGRAALNSDVGRLSVLRELGYTVEYLAANQVNDVLSFELVIKRVAHGIGKRLDRRQLGYIPARCELISELRAWKSASGVPRQRREKAKRQ